MSDHARFWFWIVLLAVACLFLGAAMSSAVDAHDGNNACNQPVDDRACPTSVDLADTTVGHAARDVVGLSHPARRGAAPTDARYCFPREGGAPPPNPSLPQGTTTRSAAGDSCFLANEQSWCTAWPARSLPSRTRTSSRGAGPAAIAIRNCASQPGIARATACASLRQRAPVDREIARVNVVPMHQTQRVRPIGASVGRPSDQRGQRYRYGVCGARRASVSRGIDRPRRAM
jgi:hypothetical protein